MPPAASDDGSKTAELCCDPNGFTLNPFCETSYLLSASGEPRQFLEFQPAGVNRHAQRCVNPHRRKSQTGLRSETCS